MLEGAASLTMRQGGYEINKSRTELGDGKRKHFGLVQHSKLQK